MSKHPHKFVPAYGPFRLFLERFGYRALTMPWRSIYVLHSHWDDETLRRHELAHIEQIRRDGAIRFSVRYVWYLARHGYRNNPYEIEAYKRENDGTRN
jgi:hypothetical protein